MSLASEQLQNGISLFKEGNIEEAATIFEDVLKQR